MPVFLLILRFLVVIFFLVMFLRRPTTIWGIGLLTVTTAILLDAVAAIFGGNDALVGMGYFRSVVQGALLAGAAIWLWGVLRPVVGLPNNTSPIPTNVPALSTNQAPHAAAARLRAQPNTVYDRQMMYNQIRYRLGREDIFDLIFDLGLNENDIVGLDQEINQIVVRLMDIVEQQSLAGALALAVERILTPPAPESLPRPEKLSAETPPTILRQYLLIHYSLAQLEQMCQQLGIDWEQLSAGNKKDKVRSLLLHLYRRNRITDLVVLLHPAAE